MTEQAIAYELRGQEMHGGELDETGDAMPSLQGREGGYASSEVRGPELAGDRDPAAAGRPKLQSIEEFLKAEAFRQGEKYQRFLVTTPASHMPVVEDAYIIGRKRWFVVYTDPKSETRAFDGCKDKGFDPYMPKAADWKRQTAREIKQNKPKEQVFRPVLTRYLFVRLPILRDGTIPFGFVRSINGVREFVGTADGPLSLTDALVDEIKQRESRGEFDFVKKSGHVVVPKWLSAGAEVEVVEGGPFAGFIGLIQSILPNGLIKVGVNIFERLTPVTLELAQVKQIG